MSHILKKRAHIELFVLYTDISVCLSVYLSMHPSINLSTNLSIYCQYPSAERNHWKIGKIEADLLLNRHVHLHIHKKITRGTRKPTRGTQQFNLGLTQNRCSTVSALGMFSSLLWMCCGCAYENISSMRVRSILSE